ncbi:flagellar protein FliT [Mangrovitalea sediminis]|uniref:flagellar protein FliT n=1 Tax=Mangrovitalea sediminis TaxID=1982043 RepID=UPI000BE5F64C|nr:flagellar protein FliT [Mangrovitalea sediminis]
MDNVLKALDELAETLAAAVERGDWDTVTALDENLQASVEAAMAEARAGDISAEALRARLDTLQELYMKAREIAVKSRDKAALALRQMGKTHEAANAYLDVSKPRRD